MAKPYSVSTIGVSLDLQTADGETVPINRGNMSDNQLKQLMSKIVVLVEMPEDFPDGFQLPTVKVSGEKGDFTFVTSGAEEFECLETDDDYEVKGCLKVVRGEDEFLKRQEMRRERFEEVHKAEQKKRSKLSYKIGVGVFFVFVLYYFYRYAVTGSYKAVHKDPEMIVLAAIMLPIVLFMHWREKKKKKKEDDYLSGKTDKFEP